MHHKLKVTLAVTATTLTGLQINGHADETPTTETPTAPTTQSQTNPTITASANIEDKEAAVTSAQIAASNAAVSVSMTNHADIAKTSQINQQQAEANHQTTAKSSNTESASTSANSQVLAQHTVENQSTTSTSTVASVKASQATDVVSNHTPSSTQAQLKTATKTVAPADADGEITQLIGSATELPTKLIEPANLANGTESRNGDYYGWYDVDTSRDNSQQLQIVDNRLITSQQKELADYTLELINSFRQDNGLTPLIMSDKIWKAVSDRELAYRSTHPTTTDNHTTFIELGSHNQSYNPTQLFIQSSSQNLGFGSATTMLEAKIEILNAFTAMAYKDGDSNNTHRETMLIRFKPDQVGMLIPFVDYVGNRGSTFTWNYLTDFVIFDKRDLTTFEPVTNDRVNQELGLTQATANQNAQAASQQDITAHNSQNTAHQTRTHPQQAVKHTNTNHNDQITHAKPQTVTSQSMRVQPIRQTSVNTVNVKDTVLTEANTAGIELQNAKEELAQANADLVLAKAQANTMHTQPVNQTITKQLTQPTPATLTKSDSRLANKQQHHTLPNTAVAENPQTTLTGIGLLLSILGFGMTRRKRH